MATADLKKQFDSSVKTLEKTAASKLDAMKNNLRKNISTSKNKKEAVAAQKQIDKAFQAAKNDIKYACSIAMGGVDKKADEQTALSSIIAALRKLKEDTEEAIMKAKTDAENAVKAVLSEDSIKKVTEELDKGLKQIHIDSLQDADTFASTVQTKMTEFLAKAAEAAAENPPATDTTTPT